MSSARSSPSQYVNSQLDRITTQWNASKSVCTSYSQHKKTNIIDELMNIRTIANTEPSTSSANRVINKRINDLIEDITSVNECTVVRSNTVNRQNVLHSPVYSMPTRITNSDRKLLFYVAAENGLAEFIKSDLDNGVDPNYVHPKSGMSALEAAIKGSKIKRTATDEFRGKRDYIEVIRLLLQYGATNKKQ